MKKNIKKNKCGIYKIHCVGNDRDYIGSAVKHLSRWNSHRSMLGKSIHTNRHLQNAYNKYGKDSFTYTLLEECAEEDLIQREQYWIDSYDFDELMNSSLTASTSIGFKHSNETKKIISEKAQQRENKHLKKYRFKKGDKNLFEGQKHTEETIEKLKRIQSTRTYKTGGHNKGIPMPEDLKLRISKTTSQNRRVYGDEVEEKVKELRKLGWTFQKISEELGVSRPQASRMAKGQRAHYKLKYEVKK